MRIHVTYAGGTIGMVDSPDGLRPGADMASWLNTQFDGIELSGHVSMSQLSPLVDSSETTPTHWQMIIDDIRAHGDEADAFLVLHGTDTMAYSAAALSYALADFTKPIVLTGSQYPLGVVGTDASANVTGALRAAGSSQVSGVTLFFGHMLLAGNRSTKTSSWAFAGLSAARLRSMFTPLPEAVIIRAYGVGNIPASDPGFVDVLQELREAEVPLIVASQCHQAEVVLGHYEAGSTLARLGAISAHDMTLEALYAKTIFLLSQGLQGEEFAQWMNRSIAGEVSLPGIA